MNRKCPGPSGHRFEIGLALGGVFLAGCSLITGSDGGCEERAGISVCITFSEAPPGSVLHATVRNDTGEPQLLDLCSPQTAGRSDERTPFREIYRPERQCGGDVTTEEILATAVVIAAGGSVTDSFGITGGARQGQYRRSYWFLLPDGSLADPEPYVSPVFDIFPSADPVE